MKEVSPYAAVTAIGFALSTIFAFAKQMDAEFNSPEMIQARANVERQQAFDKITADANVALKPGADLTQVGRDLS